jgi:hypothetical protein
MNLRREVRLLDAERLSLQRQLADAEADLQRRVDARVSLVLAAQAAGVHVDGSWSDVAVIRAVLERWNPSVRLDGETDDFIAGAYAVLGTPSN